MTYIVDAIDNALKLLSYVAEHPGLGVTELSEQLSINKSRAYRMLYTLESHRFVVQDSRNATYTLGPQAFVLGVAAAQQNTLVREASRHMLALNQAINETVVLRVREGIETVCVARCETTHQVRAVGAVGNRRPIGLGASGKLLLAFAPEAIRAEYLARSPEAAGPDALVEELAAIARQGYAVSLGEMTPGAIAISTSIRDISGDTVAAVAISGPEMRIDSQKIPDYLQRLKACADAISSELGYSGKHAAQPPG